MLTIESPLRLKARHVIQANGSLYPEHWVIAPDAWRAPAWAHCFAGEKEATLLAAAPELLVTLEGILDHVDDLLAHYSGDVGNDVTSDLFAARKKASAAIARAKVQP